MPSCDAWEVTSAEPPAKRPKVCEEDDSGSDPRSHFNPPFKIFHIPNAKCWVCGEKYSSPYIRLRQSLPEGSGVSAGSFIKMQCQCCPQPPSPDFSRSPMANPMPPHELRQLGNNSRSMRFGHPGCSSSRGSGDQDATCATGLRMPHPLQMCHSLCPHEWARSAGYSVANPAARTSNREPLSVNVMAQSPPSIYEQLALLGHNMEAPHDMEAETHGFSTAHQEEPLTEVTSSAQTSSVTRRTFGTSLDPWTPLGDTLVAHSLTVVGDSLVDTTTALRSKLLRQHWPPRRPRPRNLAPPFYD